MTIAPGVPALLWGAGEVVIEPPGGGDGAWAGAPSAILVDGVYWLAYRLRLPLGAGRGIANVVARSVDGVHFDTVAVVDKEPFGAESLERPALVVTDEVGGGSTSAAQPQARSTGVSTWWKRPRPRASPPPRHAPCCPAMTPTP